MTSGSRPIIGITSYAQPARWGAWDLPAALVPLYYVESVELAGGRAIVVPPSEQGIDETLDILDGIVFSGGIDIDPAQYGAERHPATDPAQVHRDAGELRLLEAALERDVPTLAICRGFQLLNILRGGDLIQHLPEHVGHEGHRETLGVFSQHPVEVREGTRLEAILGQRHGAVHSSHHQGVGRVGEGLVESAFAEDGSLEAIEDPSKTFALGVLWHPEMEADDKRLFEALVGEAAAYRARRDGS
jgi:putative glutamine amidotransferase